MDTNGSEVDHEQVRVHLAEHFHSLQGEGTWVGTPMHFVRLAGCSVGKKITHESGTFTSLNPPVLPSGRPAWLCHRFDGTSFWCDTDFGKREESTVEQLLQDTWEDHICLTGGEPLNHLTVVRAFAKLCADNAKMLHIETSGTIDYGFLAKDQAWITVSPKQGCLSECLIEADEIKLLVGPETFTELPPEIEQHPNVFVSPINEVNCTPIKGPAFAECMRLLQHFPHWRLSVQLHKYLGLR